MLYTDSTRSIDKGKKTLVKWPYRGLWEGFNKNSSRKPRMGVRFSPGTFLFLNEVKAYAY